MGRCAATTVRNCASNCIDMYWWQTYLQKHSQPDKNINVKKDV